MKTKIVYVIVSNEQDIYLEQAWVSAYSLRQHTPDAHIVFVADEATHENITRSGRNAVCAVVDELLPVAVDKRLGNLEKSRWLKTNLRDIIKGDFLFVDTDTVVTGDLSEIDGWKMDVGIVIDLHAPLSTFSRADEVKKTMGRIFGCDKLHPKTEYYNSGVIYCKDTKEAHRFFKAWHDNWERGVAKGVATDQQSLVYTVNGMPNAVTPMSGDYNCQVLGSIQYLHTAKIMHFFNAKWNENTLCPFFGKEIYRQVKQANGITKEIDWQIRHCKELFPSPTPPIMGADVHIWRGPIFQVLRQWWHRHKRLYAAVLFVCKGLLWLERHICKKTLTGGVDHDVPIREHVRLAFLHEPMGRVAA